MVAARVDYQEAIRRGLGPTEINPAGDAAEEMRRLWMSVRRRLARMRPYQQAGQRAA
jgi:chromosome partitioning protein